MRGVNINFADFDDYMLRQLDIADYKVEVSETDTLDQMVVFIELPETSAVQDVAARVAHDIKVKFEISPEMEILVPGSLEAEFTGQVKQNRFIDQRG